MISFFNRAELITVFTMEKLMAVREALANAGIASTVKTRGAARGLDRSRTGSFGLRQEVLYTYTIYVRKEDLDRGRQAIRAALENV